MMVKNRNYLLVVATPVVEIIGDGVAVVVFGWKHALTTTSALTGLLGSFLMRTTMTLRISFLLLLMTALPRGLIVCKRQRSKKTIVNIIV